MLTLSTTGCFVTDGPTRLINFFLYAPRIQASTDASSALIAASNRRALSLRGDTPGAPAAHHRQPGGGAQRHPRHAAPHRSPGAPLVAHDGAASQVRDARVVRARDCVPGWS